MARLSASPFLSPPKTSTSNRLSKMFKSTRGSLSPSTDKASIRSVPSLSSSKLRKGFEKVGLFPSDRRPPGLALASDSRPYTAAGMVAEQAKESKGMSVPHSLDTNLQPVTVERSPTAELSPSGSWVRDWENTLKTQQELAKLKTQSIEEAREAQEVAALYHRFLGDSDSDRADFNPTNIAIASKLSDENESTETNTERIISGGNVPGTDQLFMMNDPCGSSYVSDAQRSTPKQKIVLAVTEHPPAPIESQKEKETNEVNTSLPSPLFDAMIAEAKLAPVHKALANATRIIYVFGSTRENLKLGPVKITNPVLIQYAQQLFPAIYLLMFVWAALDSPTTLWISLWKTTIYGILYWMALEMLEWWDAEVPDVLLEPLVYRFPVAVSAGAKTVGFRVGEIIGMFMEGFWDGYQRSNAV